MLFSFPSYEEIARQIQNDFSWERGTYTFERFSNAEHHLSLSVDVATKDCYLLGTIAPPDENLILCASLSHTLKKEGAYRCIAILPYLAYTRHDHEEKRKSQMTGLIGKILAASGIDHIVTIDVHSTRAKELLSIPMTCLSPSRLIAKNLVDSSFIPDVIVAPDLGAKQRCQDVADAFTEHLNISIPVNVLPKSRQGNDIYHKEQMLGVGKRILIIDDILDTGKTLFSCVQNIASYEELVIVVTHGIFTEEIWKKLISLPRVKLYFFDTVLPIPSQVDGYPIYKMSMYPLIKEYLWKKLSTSL